MALTFLLLMTFQLGSEFGSGLLLAVTALNLVIPGIIVMTMQSGDVSALGGIMPNETDRFLMKKGKNKSVSEAMKQPQFWYLIFTCAITIGISRMMDENASLISLKNADYSQKSKRAFQTFEVVGAFLTGAFLSVFRINVSPQGLTIFNSVLLLVSQILMYFINIIPLAMMITVILVGFASGSTFTLMGVIAHEEYGLGNINRILAILMTSAAIGIFVFDELIFDWMYESFAS
jgi:hypothetical protein